MSYPAFAGPWIEAQYLKAEIAKAVQSLPADGAQESLTADLHHRIDAQATLHASEVAGLQSTVAQLEDMVRQFRHECSEQGEQLADTRRTAIAHMRRAKELRGELANVLAAVEDERVAVRGELGTLQEECSRLKEERGGLKEECGRLMSELELWHAVRTSRSYRLIRVYTSAYEIPVVGQGLRYLRRGVGKTVRALRGRHNG